MLDEKSIGNIKIMKNKFLELVKENFGGKNNNYLKIKNILDKDFNKITEADLVFLIDTVIDSDFIINSIKNNKNFTIEKGSTIIKIGEIIPFFSVRDFIEKKFKDIIDESNKNIEFYKQINYNIFGIFISIAIAILGINNGISSFTIFLLGICGFLFLISIWYFIKNYIKITKNNYRLEIIENFIKIFEKGNLNEESLDFIIKLLEKRKNEKQNTNLNQKIEIFFGNSSLSIYGEIFKEKIGFLIFSIIYFFIYFYSFNYIKDFLIEFSKK
ncbi:hypothetical protein D8B46_00490 [Candidatus Gracilibacteria bacterium]|nr:MAG: hypothetical protein D8B46_00490 [Candidatus Gracilibacteria bacterium]